MKKISNLIKHPLFAGSFVMIFGSNAVSFINYFYHIVMSRILGPVNYGELAAIISLIGLLGVIPGSLNLVVIKYISAAKNDKEVSAMINWLKKKVLVVAIIFAIITFLASPFISSFLHINNIYYLILVSISLLFSIQALFNRAILQGVLKFKEMVISVLAENIIKLSVGVLAVFLGFQVGGAVVGFVIAAFLGWFITTFFLHRFNRQTSKIRVNLNQLLTFAVPVFVQTIAVTSLYSSDIILVKHYLPAHDAGIYAALSNLGKIIFFGAGPIGAVMFPLVSKRSALGQNYKQIFRYSFFATIFLAASVLIIYWLFPQMAISLLYGKLYLGAANLLIWFGIFMSLFTLSTLLISYNLSLGKSSVVVFPLVAALTQIILIIFFHQSLFTVISVSIIVTALLLLSLLIYSTYAKRN